MANSPQYRTSPIISSVFNIIGKLRTVTGSPTENDRVAANNKKTKTLWKKFLEI